MNRIRLLSSRFLVLGWIIAIIAASPVTHAAEENSDSASRQKVGLVLSGGGGRGVSHIGVLQWMEEHRIPVDYLTGTSIGGLIGGLYAMDMSPKEMKEFIHSIDWGRVFGTGVNYEELSFRRKQDRRQYSIDLEFGLKNGLSGPPGLSTGHQVGLLIDRVTLPYSTMQNFDQLPIPFRCMGADIIAAEPVEMSDGLLSTAMRATMSLPGIFPPVRRNDRWLIDGGVLNNIPTDVMRNDFHPDIVIAVNVGTPLSDEKVVNSMLGVLSQTVGVMTYGSDTQRLKLADLVIQPELEGITVTDFENVDATAERGYAAAEKMKADLEKFSLDEVEWQKYVASKSAKRRTQVPVPAGIQVTGVSERATQVLQTRLSLFAGKPLDTAALEKELTYVAGEGRYQSLDYGLVDNAAGNPELQVRVIEKPYAPPTLNFNLILEGSDISDFNFGFGTRLTFYDVGVFNSEWRNDVDLGFNSRLATEYFVPVKGKVFMAPYGYYRRGQESFYSGGERAAEYDVNWSGIGADFGYLTWRNEFRIGYEYGRIDAGLSAGTAPITDLAGKVDFLRARYTFDGVNSATIPTRGTRLVALASYYLSSPYAESEFPQGEVLAGHFHPVSKSNTLFISGGIGTTFDKDAAPAQKYRLGGPVLLSAYDPNEFTGNHYVILNTGFMHQIYELPPLIGGKVWVVGLYTVGSAFNDFNEIDYQNQGALALAMDTRLGPFLIEAAVGEHGDANIFFAFGKFF